MSREWTQNDYHKILLSGNKKEGTNEVVSRRARKDGIYTAMVERDMGYIERWVREMGYIERWLREIWDI